MQPLGLYCLVGRGGGSGAGLNGDCGRGVPRPSVGLAGGGGSLRRVDDGALGDKDVDEALDGSCWVAASVVEAAAGGRRAWIVVGGGSWLGSGFWLGRCRLGLCLVFVVLWAAWGQGLG